MKKITVTILSILFIFSMVSAQKTNDNNSQGGNNNNVKPNDNTNNNDNNNNSDNTCLSSVMDLGGVLAGAYHHKLLGSKKKNPSVTSFEMGLIGGLATASGSNFYNILPNIKGNYGAYSGEIRFNQMIYKDDTTIKTSGIDALAEFNIIAGQVFKFEIGQGLYYDFDLKKGYHESLLGMELGFMKRRILFAPDFRYVYDWTNSVRVFSEFGLTGSFKFLEAGPLNLYVCAGAAYRSFVVSDYTIYYGGLNIVLQ